MNAEYGVASSWRATWVKNVLSSARTGALLAAAALLGMPLTASAQSWEPLATVARDHRSGRSV